MPPVHWQRKIKWNKTGMFIFQNHFLASPADKLSWSVFSLHSTSFYNTAMDLQIFPQDEMLLEKGTRWKPKILKCFYSPSSNEKVSREEDLLEISKQGESRHCLTLHIHGTLRKTFVEFIVISLFSRITWKHCWKQSQIMKIFLVQENKKFTLPHWHFYKFPVYFANSKMLIEQNCKRQPQINII